MTQQQATTMESTKQTKVCAKCGQTLPVEKFYHNSHSEDGYGESCRSCCIGRRNKLTGSNPAIAVFTPRELIAELRSRGYKGKLQIVQEINV